MVLTTLTVCKNERIKVTKRGVIIIIKQKDMKIKTFWLILLKIIGFFLVLKGVNVIIYSFTTFSFISSMDNNTQQIILFALSIVVTVIVYLFILWLFVFKTSWLIDKLHLEKGFEEEKIEINVQLSNILSIAIIVIGGLTLIESLPQLCKQVFSFFQMKSMNIEQESQTKGWIILYFIQACLGYLLMTNSKRITNFINKRATSDSTDENKQSE